MLLFLINYYIEMKNNIKYINDSHFIFYLKNFKTYEEFNYALYELASLKALNLFKKNTETECVTLNIKLNDDKLNCINLSIVFIYPYIDRNNYKLENLYKKENINSIIIKLYEINSKY